MRADLGVTFTENTAQRLANGESLEDALINAGASTLTDVATDPETDETAEKEVVEFYINESSELAHLTINGNES